MEICGQQEKVASRPHLLLRYLYIKIQNLFGRYAKLTVLSGWDKIPFYESGQEEIGPGLWTTQLCCVAGAVLQTTLPVID